MSGLANVVPMGSAESLSLALEDIGARNSDVLLSDAVLFVEGEGDEATLNAWSNTLNLSLSEHNITILMTRGGEYAARHAPTRSGVLTGISQKAPIPHLFVLDRDERRPEEVSRLEATLQDRVQFLHRRELENYFLVPRALREAMRLKFLDNPSRLAQIESASDSDIMSLIQGAADSLHGQVLLKRIRAIVGGLQEGLLSRQMITDLSAQIRSGDLAQLLAAAITSRLQELMVGLDLPNLVRSEKERLDIEWADPSQRLILAPGEEIVDGVYKHFGARYKKPEDTVRIAEAMTAEEIAGEIEEILRRVISWTGQLQDSL